MLAIAIAAMALFISEATPLPITCMMIIFTMKYTGVVPWKTIQQTACSSTIFFCMAGFGLGAALQNTNLAAIISIFVSDGAAQIVTLAGMLMCVILVLLLAYVYTAIGFIG